MIWILRGGSSALSALLSVCLFLDFSLFFFVSPLCSLFPPCLCLSLVLLFSLVFFVIHSMPLSQRARNEEIEVTLLPGDEGVVAKGCVFLCVCFFVCLCLFVCCWLLDVGRWWVGALVCR